MLEYRNMASLEARRWSSDPSGPTRRDRRPGRYSVYLPDPLVGRRFVLDGEVAAEVAAAEADLARLDQAAAPAPGGGGAAGRSGVPGRHGGGDPGKHRRAGLGSGRGSAGGARSGSPGAPPSSGTDPHPGPPAPAGRVMSDRPECMFATAIPRRPSRAWP